MHTPPTRAAIGMALVLLGVVPATAAAGSVPAGLTAPAMGLGGGGPLGAPAAAATGACISDRDRARVSAQIEHWATTPQAQALASQAMAPFEAYPMAGRWSRDLFTNNYNDLDPGPGVLDHSCGDWTYDGHDATDTNLRTFDEQLVGVPVFAVRDGVVAATHDGEFDMNTATLNQPANYVIIDHGGGLSTRYWHLKKDSVAVTVGQSVRAGEQLGLTGSSGNSTGPHLHFATTVGGQAVEPFHGECQDDPSWWRQQQPKPHSAYLYDFGFTREDLSTITNPILGMPRTGQFELGDPRTSHWVFLPALPAFSTWRVRYRQPDGVVAFDSGTRDFNNPQEYRWSWWWWWYDIPAMHVLPGAWQLELIVNGRQLIRAPFDVVASIDPLHNTPPEPITTCLQPTNPGPGDVIHCQVDSHLGLDDRDYDVVRYHYRWEVDGQVVRELTSAAMSDALPAGSAPQGSLLTCTVTPWDEHAPGTEVSTARVIDCRGADVVTVDGRMNLLAAGHAVPDAPGGGGPGLAPREIALAGLDGDVLSFSVSGSVSPGSAGSNGPDGGTLYGGVTDVTSWDGVSGLVHGERTMFLAGVFLDREEPVEPAPPRLDAGVLAQAVSVSPALSQAFFIGDGLTGTGAGQRQRFHAPPGATRLLLGFVDGSVFLGAPGFYDDNSGLLTVEVTRATCVFDDLGGSTPGQHGDPLLRAAGALLPATPLAVQLESAPALVPTLMQIGLDSLPLDVLGGTLYSHPPTAELKAFTLGDGSLPHSFVWPAGVPAGLTVVFQTIVADASVPKGLTLSNAVTATAP